MPTTRSGGAHAWAPAATWLRDDAQSSGAQPLDPRRWRPGCRKAREADEILRRAARRMGREPPELWASRARSAGALAVPRAQRLPGPARPQGAVQAGGVRRRVGAVTARGRGPGVHGRLPPARERAE